MSISHTLNRSYRHWPALAATLILIVCCSHRGAAGATIKVTTPQQGVTNGQCSLQEAIYASTFQSNKAISSPNPDVFYNTGCTAGTGDDTIELVPGEHYGFHLFWEGDGHNIFGPTATPIIVSKIIIQGNGATLQSFDRDRPNNSRLFAIGTVNDPNFPSTTGNLTLKNVYIKDFHIKGGDGANGGGGGLGAGGAIYNEGSLTIENSTFEHNGAVGGRGSGGTSGGGGGLFGNGGRGCERSAGGGGGARGNGGDGSVSACAAAGGGGGGGGTVLAGMNGLSLGEGGAGGAGGFDCGGKGGSAFTFRHGGASACPGGGGGGAAGNPNPLCFLFNSCFPAGGTGNFGGGGSGGMGDGGPGGFGGGGGAAFDSFVIVSGGGGGFGGGGGASGSGAIFHHPGAGGNFGGHADQDHGGGGGALGGAIFNRTGRVSVTNSTFFNNFVTRGEGGGGSADKGADAGGAIFSMGRSLDVNDSTFSGNEGTGSGAAIVVITDTDGSSSVNFVLNNTIIANNGPDECYVTGSVSAKGVANLIMQNGTGAGPPGHQRGACPGFMTSSDPQLQPLQLNGPGNTPTMAITTTSPAARQGDPHTSLAGDQRGVSRLLGAGPDIGAFEATSGKCAEATAFLVRANAIVAIDAPHTTAYNDLICGLVEDGTYSKLDTLYVLATQSDGGSPGDGIAKLNLIKDSFNLVRHGMCAFAADKGVACDGASGYYDTQFNLATSGVAFSRDSASLGVYDRTSTTTSGTVFGAVDVATFTALQLNVVGELFFRINSINDGPVAANSNAQGFWIGIRTGASAVSVYRNGNQIASSTTPSNGVPALSIYLCATNVNGTANFFVGDEVAAFFIGGDLTKTQTAGISVRINAFMKVFGTNVY
jgi:hypothetical protein